MRTLRILPSALLGVVLMIEAVTARDIYVSTDGNDANPGDGPAADQALRTIQAGADRMNPGDMLYIRGGVYRETVTFSRSGLPGRPLTVQPYNEERVVVSGCDPVSGWEPYRQGVWKAPMEWTLGKGRNQVFADGRLMIEARFPNVPSEGLGMYVSDLSPLWPTFGDFSIPDPVDAPGRVVSDLLNDQPDGFWKGACYYGVHYQGWSAQTGIITDSKAGEITVEDRTRTWWFPGKYSHYKPEEGRGMIVGHMNALDTPGEWHWQDDSLYLMTLDGAAPVRVEAKRRQLAFDLSGCKHISIRGLDVQSASMRLANSAHCVVDSCRLQYISHFRRFYAIGQIEDGRDTIKSGETGIYISGHDNSFLNCTVRYSAGAGFHVRGYHHTIHNCLIDEIDYTSHYLNAITDAVSDFPDYEHFLVGGHVITYNTMRNAGRHFFNFYGNGTSKVSRDRAPMDYMGTLFAHNHLYNGMLQTKDAGFLTGYYCSGGTLNGLNSQVVYNAMHDCYDIFGMRIHKLGIVYLDAGTCDVDLHHNLLWAAPGSHQRGLWYNTMCVDINEHDNVFHEEFERTCAELAPADFPEKRAFRFGHDFDDPPPLPVWPQLERRTLEAESHSASSPGVTVSAGTVGGLTDGSWLAFDGVDFDAGWQSAVVRLASAAEAMNADRTMRKPPRHRHATDPLVMEAIVNDGTHDAVRRQWTFVYNNVDGAWLRFNQVPLGEGYRRFRVVYGNDQHTARWLEVRLDAVDGPLVSRVDLPRTDDPRGGRIQIYSETTGEVSADAVGTHDVLVVFRSADGMPVGEFTYFRFEQYRGAIPLQPGDVTFELRLDTPTGIKIGEIFPRATGGAEVFSDLVASLEPVSGVHRLCVVVRSALSGDIGYLDSFRLEKARHPVDWTGVGVAARRDAAGNLVLPEPTNRPCARPNDKYPKAATTTVPSGPRPLFAATRLARAPVIDGKLDEWETLEGVNAMRLMQSYDGSATPAPHSRAWIGYDDDALYIAVENPVSDTSRLDVDSHTWGATDAMEVAIQDGFAEKPGPILNLYGWPDSFLVSTGEAGAPWRVVDRLGKAVNYRAAVGSEAWTCEWQIPFEACGFTPETAPMVLFNLGVRKVADGAWVIWRGTGGATYRVADAGVVVFPDEFSGQFALPQEGLAVWLDAAGPDAVETDAEGRAMMWRDRSGNDRHAEQRTPAYRPQFVADALNGRPALRFSETSHTRLELPDLSDEKTDATVFAVFSNPKPSLPVNHHARIFTASDGKGFDYLIGLSCNVAGTETGGPRTIVSVFRDRWAKSVRVGCFSPNYQTFFSGDISEILVYDRVLSEAEQDRVRACLMLKWGLE